MLCLDPQVIEKGSLLINRGFAHGQRLFVARGLQLFQDCFPWGEPDTPLNVTAAARVQHAIRGAGLYRRPQSDVNKKTPMSSR
jgi:hypothetical protein